MGDTMLLGVLRMPLDDPDPVTLMQFLGRARQAADRIEADAKEIKRLREALWVCAEHNALHFGETHNTVIQARDALTRKEDKTC